MLDSLEKCLKRGEDAERAVAAAASTLLVLQLASELDGQLAVIISELKIHASDSKVRRFESSEFFG